MKKLSDRSLLSKPWWLAILQPLRPMVCAGMPHKFHVTVEIFRLKYSLPVTLQLFTARATFCLSLPT
jgi:hypothetical protein